MNLLWKRKAAGGDFETGHARCGFLTCVVPCDILPTSINRHVEPFPEYTDFQQLPINRAEIGLGSNRSDEQIDPTPSAGRVVIKLGCMAVSNDRWGRSRRKVIATGYVL